jgi:hypothetical protein
MGWSDEKLNRMLWLVVPIYLRDSETRHLANAAVNTRLRMVIGGSLEASALRHPPSHFDCVAPITLEVSRIPFFSPILCFYKVWIGDSAEW